MRGRDERAAANRRAIDALYQARRRAITDCQSSVEPMGLFADEMYRDGDELRSSAWDDVNMDYRRSEWPPSLLN